MTRVAAARGSRRDEVRQRVVAEAQLKAAVEAETREPNSEGSGARGSTGKPGERAEKPALNVNAARRTTAVLAQAQSLAPRLSGALRNSEPYTGREATGRQTRAREALTVRRVRGEGQNEKDADRHADWQCLRLRNLQSGLAWRTFRLDRASRESRGLVSLSDDVIVMRRLNARIVRNAGPSDPTHTHICSFSHLVSHDCSLMAVLQYCISEDETSSCKYPLANCKTQSLCVSALAREVLAELESARSVVSTASNRRPIWKALSA